MPLHPGHEPKSPGNNLGLSDQLLLPNVPATTQDHVYTLVMKLKEPLAFLIKFIKFNSMQPPTQEQTEVSDD